MIAWWFSIVFCMFTQRVTIFKPIVQRRLQWFDGDLGGCTTWSWAWKHDETCNIPYMPSSKVGFNFIYGIMQYDCIYNFFPTGTKELSAAAKRLWWILHPQISPGQNPVPCCPQKLKQLNLYRCLETQRVDQACLLNDLIKSMGNCFTKGWRILFQRSSLPLTRLVLAYRGRSGYLSTHPICMQAENKLR